MFENEDDTPTIDAFIECRIYEARFNERFAVPGFPLSSMNLDEFTTWYDSLTPLGRQSSLDGWRKSIDQIINEARLQIESGLLQSLTPEERRCLRNEVTKYKRILDDCPDGTNE